MSDGRDGRSGREWLIKSEIGKQSGPFETQAVLKMISDGSFVGTEQIKRYPDGKWIAISREPEFYDKLLEALEETKSSRKKSEESILPGLKQNTFSSIKLTDVLKDIWKPGEPKDNIQDEVTVLASIPNIAIEVDHQKSDAPESEDEAPPASPLVPLEPAGSKKNKNRKIPNSAKLGAGSLTPISFPQNQKTIDLQNIQHISRNGKIKSARLPAILGALAVILFIVAYFMPDDEIEKSGKPNLLVPRESRNASLSGNEVKDGIKGAVAEYVNDTYESYSEAQSRLISVIEGAPKNVEARGTLCLVYKELWPFVKQDSADMAAVNTMARATRSLDPIGIQGVYCEIVKLMTQGKYTEARGIIEYSLNQASMATSPILYGLKAEILSEDREAKTAVLYAQKASELWPDWIKAKFDIGKYQSKTEQYPEAMKSLQAVIAKNPKHKMAQIELGTVLFRGYKHADETIKALKAALATPGKISGIHEATANFFLGLAYAEKKDLAQAKIFAEKAYKLNPSDPQSKELLVKLGGQLGNGEKASNNELVFLGDQHVRTGNWLAAQAEYKAAFDLDPKNAVAAMKAAKCLWELAQAKEANLWLNKAIAADPKLISAYVLKADYLSERYNYVEAIQVLAQASKVFPNNYEVLRGYGLIEYRRNNVKDALGYFGRAYRLYENDIDTLVLLAKAHSLNGDYSAAQRFAIRAIELDSTNKEAQIIYANVMTQFQGLETGILYLKDLITKFSYTTEFKLALADLYKNNDRFGDAQKIYEQILDIDPKNKRALLGLGQSFQGQVLFEKALKAYLNAAVLDPSDAEALWRAGLTYIDSLKYKDAVTQLERARAINPLFPRVNYYIGQAYFENGEYEKALDASLAERKVNPNIADSYILAAEVFASTRQFQKCAAEYQKAIKLRPQGADLYVKVARCYRQSGSLDIAESMVAIAASQESGLPDIYKEQGAIFEMKGDMRAAVQSYNKYLALSPNAPDRKAIENKVNSLGGN
jgi:tetratricopeptide (TPR) repeat protein